MSRSLRSRAYEEFAALARRGDSKMEPAFEIVDQGSDLREKNPVILERRIDRRELDDYRR